MVILLILIIYITLYYYGYRKYNKWISQHNTCFYPLKFLLPAGLGILNIINYRFGSNEDKRLFHKITFLEESRAASDYVKIHQANRIVLLMTGILISVVFFSIMGIDLINILFCSTVIFLLIYSGEKELDKRIAVKKLGIDWDFPEFLNMLTLLIGAGLTVSNAWEKVLSNNKTGSELYIQAGKAIREIRSGKSEIKAYEDFSRRIKNVEVSRFISVLIQNLRKGNTELSSILSVIAGESWINRKNTVKKLGEEASSKLLFPMMLMFIALVIVIVTPAVISLQNI